MKPLFEIDEGIPHKSTHEIHQHQIECPKCGQKINIPYAVRKTQRSFVSWEKSMLNPDNWTDEMREDVGLPKKED